MKLMTILETTLLLAAIYTVLLLLSRRSLLKSPPVRSVPQRVLLIVSLLSQFIVLYYHEQFWHNFLFYIVPLYTYFFMLVWVVVKRFKLAFVYSVMRIISGSFWNVLLYYLFFYPRESPLLGFRIAAVDKTATSSWWSWWPLVAAVVCTGLVLYLIKLVRTSSNAQALFFILTFLLLMLPLFSQHIVWAMLLSSGLVLSTCILVSRRISLSEQLGFWVLSIGFFIVQLVMGIGLLIIS